MEQQGFEFIPIMQQQQPANYGSVPGARITDTPRFLDTIDPNKSIDLIYHDLKGEVLNNSGNWVQLPELKERALTEEGARKVTSMLRAASTFNMTFSRITKDEVRERLRHLGLEIIKVCIKQQRAFGIHDGAQITYIKSLTMSNTIGTLNQAGEGSLQDVVSGGLIKDNYNAGQEQKKQGLFSSIFGRK